MPARKCQTPESTVLCELTGLRSRRRDCHWLHRLAPGAGDFLFSRLIILQHQPHSISIGVAWLDREIKSRETSIAAARQTRDAVIACPVHLASHQTRSFSRIVVVHGWHKPLDIDAAPNSCFEKGQGVNKRLNPQLFRRLFCLDLGNIVEDSQGRLRVDRLPFRPSTRLQTLLSFQIHAAIDDLRRMTTAIPPGGKVPFERAMVHHTRRHDPRHINDHFLVRSFSTVWSF